MELTHGDNDADLVIEGHEAEAAARVETVDEAHEGCWAAPKRSRPWSRCDDDGCLRAAAAAGGALARRGVRAPARERLYGAIEDSEKEPDDASVERTLEDLVDEWRDDGDAR